MILTFLSKKKIKWIKIKNSIPHMCYNNPFELEIALWASGDAFGRTLRSLNTGPHGTSVWSRSNISEEFSGVFQGAAVRCLLAVSISPSVRQRAREHGDRFLLSLTCTYLLILVQ